MRTPLPSHCQSPANDYVISRGRRADAGGSNSRCPLTRGDRRLQHEVRRPRGRQHNLTARPRQPRLAPWSVAPIVDGSANPSRGTHRPNPSWCSPLADRHPANEDTLKRPAANRTPSIQPAGVRAVNPRLPLQRNDRLSCAARGARRRVWLGALRLRTPKVSSVLPAALSPSF